PTLTQRRFAGRGSTTALGPMTQTVPPQNFADGTLSRTFLNLLNKLGAQFGRPPQRLAGFEFQDRLFDSLSHRIGMPSFRSCRIFQAWPAPPLKSFHPLINRLPADLIFLGQIANPEIATQIISDQTNSFTHRTTLFPRHGPTVTHVPGRFCNPCARNEPINRPPLRGLGMSPRAQLVTSLVRTLSLTLAD